MLVAILVAVLSVSFGTLVPFVTSLATRTMGRVRIVTVFGVVAVVLLHLLREAISTAGWGALLVFAAGLVVPGLVRRILGRSSQTHDHMHGLSPAESRLELDVSYWGLLIHQVGDGVALGTYGLLSRPGNRYLDVLMAIAVHTVPLVAVITLGYLRLSNRRQAILRSAGLSLASVFGIALTGLVPQATLEQSSAWVSALVSGLLFHVGAHDVASAWKSHAHHR